MQTKPPKADPPNLRRLQFSLRTLFAIVTILAADCAVCLPILRDGQAQERHRELRRRVPQLQTIAGLVFQSALNPCSDGPRSGIMRSDGCVHVGDPSILKAACRDGVQRCESQS
jgi:hypothetical protein